MPKNSKQKDKKEKAYFTVNKELNKYRKMDLFKDKVDKTNHILNVIIPLVIISKH